MIYTEFPSCVQDLIIAQIEFLMDKLSRAKYVLVAIKAGLAQRIPHALYANLTLAIIQASYYPNTDTLVGSLMHLDLKEIQVLIIRLDRHTKNAATFIEKSYQHDLHVNMLIRKIQNHVKMLY